MIVGCPGAGKSTAARALSARTGLPIIHLDYHYWRAGWVPEDPARWPEKVAALARQPRWIMDGNYANTLPYRIAHADTLIHLDFPTWLCMSRVIRRTLVNLGRERHGEFVAGCPERFDFEFLRFVWRYRRDFRSRDVASWAAFEGRILHFTHPRALVGFLAQMS